MYVLVCMYVMYFYLNSKIGRSITKAKNTKLVLLNVDYRR